MSVRILTVRQPWAWSIIYAGKDVENRTRSLGPYRGPVLIHASLQTAAGAWGEVERISGKRWREDDDVRGAIIGAVDLVDVHHADWCWDGPGIHCSPWGQSDVYHLALANPRALDEPIPYKGGLGLRRTRFDIAGQWLVEQTDRCTCGQGASLGALYGHEPGCGLEQAARLQAVIERG